MSVKATPEYRPRDFFVTALALVVMATKGQAAVKMDYYQLTDHLLNGYNKDVRPVMYDEKTLYVIAGFALFSIVEMDEQAQRMKTNALLRLMWYDDYLAWNENFFANISSILLKQSSVWLPDIVVSNTVIGQTDLGYDNLQVRISSFGFVSWQPTGVFETSCDMDVTYYPFDTQVCSITFTTAMSTKEELTLYVFSDMPFVMSSFSPDGIWEVVNTSAKYLSAGEPEKSQVVFSLQLKRRPTFYVLNIIVPVVLLAMTSSLVFALPAESGEMMSLSVTVLLAFAVYLTLVTEAMPKTSVQVSVLMVYVILLMALTTSSVVMSALLLRLHHRPVNKPLGSKAKRIIIVLEKLMCSVDKRGRSTSIEDKMSSQDDENVFIIGDHKKPKPIKSNTVAPHDNRDSRENRDNRDNRDNREHRDNRDNKDNKDNRDNRAEAEDGCCEWPGDTRRPSPVPDISFQLAAKTLSTFLFFVFLFFIVISTIVCIVVLVVGGARQEKSTRLT